MSNPRDTDAPSAPKHTREKAEYLIEKYDSEAASWRNQTGTGTEPGSTAEALRAIRKMGEGQYRVIRVCWSGVLKTESKTVTKLV